MKDNLINLIQLDHSNKWIMIYQATRDGFASSTFHSKCDNKPNTLVIIRSTSGNVFGGYTEQSWSGDSGYTTDPNAFIFSLINKQNKPLKMKCSKCEKALYCHRSYGPIFGGGHNLYISNNSNTNNDSHSNLGNSYSFPDYAYGSEEAKSFLAGSYKFQVSEIEVYSKN